jgi:hypothetical protein
LPFSPEVLLYFLCPQHDPSFISTLSVFLQLLKVNMWSFSCQSPPESFQSTHLFLSALTTLPLHHWALSSFLRLQLSHLLKDIPLAINHFLSSSINFFFLLEHIS